MDKFRHKSKKDSGKYVGKDKANLFSSDVKSMKENLKIREILRTVKMNSSMRLKAPRGSNVMCNKDFNDNEDFDEGSNSDELNLEEPPSATNLEIVDGKDVNTNDILKDNCNDDYEKQVIVEVVVPKNKQLQPSICKKNCNSLSSRENLSENGLNTQVENADISNDVKTGLNETLSSSPEDSNPVLQQISLPSRERKFSLDHTMLNRRESFSQSELDLHSIGKSPLERKSSFFRKKMESFFKNTSEIFKRQSLGSKSQLQRRGSMSMSLQSLNENSNIENADSPLRNERVLQSSCASLRSSSTVGCSNSSLQSQSELRLTATDQDSLPGSQHALSVSQPIGNLSLESISCLNEAHIAESLLNSRAISMSSGLDSASSKRTKSNRSNRVTWLASEGLTNYLRRVIQDEKNKEIQGCHSYQDLSSIPENHLYGTTETDSKGRRLSYQRAVSGEDHTRYQDSSMRKRTLIPENSEANFELSNQLIEFTRNGVPPLRGFNIANIPDEAFAYLLWAEHPENVELFYDWKKLSPNDEARQAVIRELITTEADYIRHLISIVEVFIAAAHALQDSGKMLDVDTERLFSNIPDVLNASLCFWEITIYPMIVDALENEGPFNTEVMAAGFCRFRELFLPYEKYVNEQTKALDYLRSLSGNTDFMAYLTWCYSHKSCNRLQLSDIMVKPMQRLTKYSLILRRIIANTDTEPERTNLIAMETYAKNYVLDLNRSIRQREELEKLEALSNSIEAYEIDFKDEDMDRYFRMFSQLNLRAPMVNCLPSHSRTIIHQGDLRYKDNVKEKEFEVRAFLLTDMLLICKKLSKGGSYPYKLIRPKYMVDKMFHFPKFSSRPNSRDIVGLIFVVVDEVGTAFQSFALSETAKDPNPHSTLKLWEMKLREAKLTYDLGVWFAKNPSRDLSEVEMDSSSDYALSILSWPRPTSDDMNIEREARERVAAMLHRSIGASTEYDFSQASMNTDSFDAGKASGTSGARTHNQRHPMHRNSTGGSSRNSRLSSFQQSTSAASHDEPQAGPSKNPYKAGTSVEHLIPPKNPDDAVTSITVNVVSESESETVVPTEPPTLQQPPPPVKSSNKLSTRSSSSHKNTLRVQPQSGVMALVHSLPDLTIDPSPPRPSQSPSPQSASEKLYQSHQELLQRNRLSAVQHHQYLSPDHRGTSYPPPSPTRASLKRGLAFSYSFKNPPLYKMGHVNSQSQLQSEAAAAAAAAAAVAAAAGPSTSQKAPASASGSGLQPMPGTSSEKVDKGDKKSKFVNSRNKGARSLSPGRKDEKGAE